LIAKPSTLAWAGAFGPNVRSNYFGVESSTEKSAFWLKMVATEIGPLFFLILIGVVYHLGTFVAMERETSIAELMAAQGVSIVPRILSTFSSFFSLYFPGFLFSSIVMTQVLVCIFSNKLPVYFISCGLFVYTLAISLASYPNDYTY